MKKLKEKKLFLLIALSGILIFNGCQKTPEKSAVVSKVEGLSEDVIAEPLKDGETKIMDMPKHWNATEKKSNDRMTITADLAMEQLDIGNLPVVEMKNLEISREELEKLTEHFADGQELYVPQIDTKNVYQKVKERIENKEGAYADAMFLPEHQEQAKALEQAIELAPETYGEDRKAEIKFQKKAENAALDAAESWWSKYIVEETSGKNEADIFFSADVGIDRESHIDAECYNSDIRNSSRFVWEAGVECITLGYIQEAIRMNDSASVSEQYKEEYGNILNQFENALGQQTFTQEEGQEKAQKLMEELGLPEMSVLTCDKVLWFPKGAMPEDTFANLDDLLWQADLKQSKAGYKYTLTREIGGLSAQQADGIATEQTADSYAPPFPVETVIITVTEDGVKYFSWEGISEEVATIAENTQLLPFESIQKKLFEQIFYMYSAIGQPAEDTAKFDYKVTDARLGYTYITAFHKPDHAWLVPTWFFEVMQGVGPTEETVKDRQGFPLMLNALDGGAIG